MAFIHYVTHVLKCARCGYTYEQIHVPQKLVCPLCGGILTVKEIKLK